MVYRTYYAQYKAENANSPNLLINLGYLALPYNLHHILPLLPYCTSLL